MFNRQTPASLNLLPGKAFPRSYPSFMLYFSVSPSPWGKRKHPLLCSIAIDFLDSALFLHTTCILSIHILQGREKYYCPGEQVRVSSLLTQLQQPANAILVPPLFLNPAIR